MHSKQQDGEQNSWVELSGTGARPQGRVDAGSGRRDVKVYGNAGDSDSGAATLWPSWPGIVAIAFNGARPPDQVQRLDLAGTTGAPNPRT